MAKSTEKTNHGGSAAFGSLDPNELKSLVRSALVSVQAPERKDSIRALEMEMSSASFNVRESPIRAFRVTSATATSLTHSSTRSALTTAATEPGASRCAMNSDEPEVNARGRIGIRFLFPPNQIFPWKETRQ